jgi:hypothetical protein
MSVASYLLITMWTGCCGVLTFFLFCLVRPIEGFSPPIAPLAAAPPLLLPQANAKVIDHNGQDPYFMCPWGQYDLEWKRPQFRPPVLLYFPGIIILQSWLLHRKQLMVIGIVSVGIADYFACYVANLSDVSRCWRTKVHIKPVPPILMLLYPQ